MNEQPEEKRFGFGKNWQSFSKQIDSKRVSEAAESLRASFQSETFENKRFLDLGCGSGLFSLAALQLGASVVSIDLDIDSIHCTKALRDELGVAEDRWQVHQGSILDPNWLESLGSADLVYCWGVAHHTGRMNDAIRYVASQVRDNGRLCLAIYNDEGGASRRWFFIKRFYNGLRPTLQPIFVFLIASFFELRFAMIRLLKGCNPLPFVAWRNKRLDRGMSVWHDWTDWVGGFPFEVAKPEDVIIPLRREGFVLENLKTVGRGWGCNEYLFSRSSKNQSRS